MVYVVTPSTLPTQVPVKRPRGADELLQAANIVTSTITTSCFIRFSSLVRSLRRLSGTPAGTDDQEGAASRRTYRPARTLSGMPRGNARRLHGVSTGYKPCHSG